MKALNLLWRIIDITLVLILTAMIVLVFANVVLRYGFASGLRPAIELSRLGFVWLVLLGASVVLRRGDHLAVTEVSAALFPRSGPLLERLRYVVIAVGCAMLFWGSFKQMNANWGNISQITGLPTALLYLAGAIAGAIMTVIALVRVVSPTALRAPGDEQHEEAHL